MNPRRSLCLLILVLLPAGRAGAISTTFTLDPNHSWLQLSAGLCTCDDFLTFEAQSLGSLITRYEGTMTVDLEPGTITFQEAQAQARNSGLHNPAGGGLPGFGTGNYGATLRQNIVNVLDLALRSITFDLESPALPLNGNNFLTPSIIATIDQGVMDYRETNFTIFPVGHGQIDLAGESANNVAGNSGTLLNGELAKLLRVPMLITIQVPLAADTEAEGPADEALFTAESQSGSSYLNLTFEGQLQGAFVVPEPGTGLPAVMIAGLLLGRRRRRSR